MAETSARFTLPASAEADTSGGWGAALPAAQPAAAAPAASPEADDEIEEEPTVAADGALRDVLAAERARAADVAVAGGVAPDHTDELAEDALEDEPEAPEEETESPRIYGPHQAKDDAQIAHVATALSNPDAESELDPSTADELGFADANLPDDAPAYVRVGVRAGRGGAIAPEPGRDAATVGGALEVDSKPERRLPPVQESAVNVDVMPSYDPTGPAPSRTASHSVQISGTRQIPAPRFSSLQVMVIAGCITLLVVGLVVLVVLLAKRGDEAAAPVTGSIVVTSNPPASCAVTLGTRPSGILEPSSSLTLSQVRAGSHLVMLECAGFLPYTTTVEVRAAQASFVVAPLQRR
jgi:hypothetical protein